MSTYTVRPTSEIHGTAGTNPVYPAQVLAALGDNSDTTVVTNTGTQAQNWVFGLGAPTIPSSEFAARITMVMRYKGVVSSGSGLYSIGLNVYRASDPRPPGYYSMIPNSSVFVSQPLYYVPTNWSLADMSNLRMVWVDNRTSSAMAVTEHADIWANIQTLAKATATPQNKTESSSVFPTIATDVAATIDWEANTQDWQNLRKVTVEVRVEQGGTGAGTGTLIASTSTTTSFTATGTQTVNVTMADPVPNGTFKVYARTLRYREDGVVYADAYGDWSSAATLTMSAPLPVAPTVTATPNDSSDTVLVNVTPIASTGYLGPYVYLQRSDDLGNTWVDVRNASGVSGEFGVASSFLDYEAPRDQTVLYRARISATYASSFINAGTWSATASAYLSATSWNIKHITDPAISAINVNVVGAPSEKIEEDLGVFRPLGRRYPVVVGGTLSGWDGEIQVVTSTSAEWNELKGLVESKAILLLESAFGWSKYVRLLPGTSSEQSGTRTTPRRTVSFAYVEVAKPAVLVGETAPTVIVPSLIDGGAGNAAGVFADSQDGGTAVTAYLAVANGGGA